MDNDNKRAVLARVDIPGQHSVTIERGKRAREFTVRYGLQNSAAMGWEDAAREFGQCVFHALECSGVAR